MEDGSSDDCIQWKDGKMAIDLIDLIQAKLEGSSGKNSV